MNKLENLQIQYTNASGVSVHLKQTFKKGTKEQCHLQ